MLLIGVKVVLTLSHKKIKRPVSKTIFVRYINHYNI